MPRASVDDIRQWGAENGWDVSGERLPQGLRSAYDDSSNGDGPVDDDGPEIEERAPQIVKANPVDRVRGMVAKARDTKPRKAVRGKLSKPRISVEKFISGAWAFLGTAAQSYHPPVARVLEMQAPVAGMILEDVVRDTIVDRVLQPLARGMNGGEVAFALLGPPLLVAALSARPDRANVLVPMLKQSLRSWVSIAGDKLEQIQKQEDDFEDKYGKRVDEMIEWFMEPLMQRPAE